MSRDAGIPFRNLTIGEADRLLAMVRAGARTRGLVDQAEALGFDRERVTGFLERNSAAIAAARRSGSRP